MSIEGLGNFGGFYQPKMDPNTFAKKFAEENNVSFEEAKSQLKSQFGDPQDMQKINQGGIQGPQQIDFSSMQNPFEMDFNALQGPQETNFGGNNSQDFNGKKEEKPDAITLMALGVPMSVIQQGNDAINNFAQDNQIELPEKRSLNLSA